MKNEEQIIRPVIISLLVIGFACAVSCVVVYGLKSCKQSQPSVKEQLLTSILY